MAHQLVGLLGCAVERDLAVDAVGLGEGLLVVAAVDRARAGVDQVLETLEMAAQFEHLEVAGDVCAHVGERIVERMAYAGLGRQMHDARDARARASRGQRAALGDVELVKREAVVGRQARQPRLLEHHIIIRIEVVDADHRVAARQQRRRNVIADEPRRPGHQNLHLAPITPHAPRRGLNNHQAGIRATTDR